MNANTLPRFLLVLAVLLLTAAVYYPGLSGDYMFDDTTNLLRNRALEFDDLTVENLDRAAFSARSGVLRRPVSMLSFALNRHFFGISPFSHKVINLVIHLCNGLLLLVLGRMLVDSYRELHRPGLRAAAVTWLPLALCALWLVHPLNLTAVLYVVQRMTSLSALFTLAGLCLYVYGRRRMLAGRHGMGWLLAGLFGCGALAALSKESGILLPLYMLVIELSLYRFRGGSGARDPGVLLFFAVCIVLPGLLGVAYLLLHAERYLAYEGRAFTLAERLLTQPRVILFYLRMIVTPSVSELGLYHDDVTHSTGWLEPPSTLYAVLATGALLAAGLALLRRMPLAALGILWFYAGHALESTILPLELVHEHRNYLASYGILLALGAAGLALPTGRLVAPVYRAAPLLFLLLFGYTTWTRSGEWSDNVNHAIFEAAHHPQSARAVFAAGRIHGRLAVNGDDGSVEPAFRHLERAALLDPAGIMPEITMIKLAFLLGTPVRDEWYTSILHKLETYPISPADIVSLQELADCPVVRCTIDADMMERIFTTALPSGNIHVMTIYGFYTINRRGNFDKGLELFTRVVETRPEVAQHWKNLINLLIVMARYDEAESRLQQFRELALVGGAESDYRLLADEIDRLRTQFAQAGGLHGENSGE